MQFELPLESSATPIPGLRIWTLPVHGDGRGWFKENWQREKMAAAGLPDFGPVQQNIAFNASRGTTRGIHAEPWDKWISVASGRVFGAWVDLREGPTFGSVFSVELDPAHAVFVPRGVGNGYQTLEDATTYAYLVNDHWSADADYSSLNLADETVGISWPIPLQNARISEKDRNHPRLAGVTAMPPPRTLVVGAGGQLGRALSTVMHTRPGIELARRADLDLDGANVETARRWQDYAAIVNAAAYTAVDEAETDVGRREAWRSNVGAVGALARVATKHGITLVHVSSDYVFDGASDRPYREDDAVSPLGVYGQTKAAGDAVVSTVPKHYIVRTSWLIGEGRNFLDTMASLADRGARPSVVDDQVGRLTFADDLARAIVHLLDSQSPYGIYNVTGSGEPMSWAEIAREVFAARGRSPSDVVSMTTAEYAAQLQRDPAPRPRNSVLDLERITGAGFPPPDFRDRVATALRR